MFTKPKWRVLYKYEDNLPECSSLMSKRMAKERLRTRPHVIFIIKTEGHWRLFRRIYKKTQTFCMLKPDAFEKIILGEVLTRLTGAGFKIKQGLRRKMSEEQAELFYAEHKGKSFFEGNIEFIMSGPCFGLILEKKNAIQELRKLIGDTDPKKADKGTIRGDFGSELPKNVIHASDSKESVKREISIFFNYKLKALNNG